MSMSRTSSRRGMSRPRRSRTMSRVRPWQVIPLACAIAAGALVPSVIGASSAVAAPVSGVVNTYQAVSGIAGDVVTVSGATRGASVPFAVGDRVMLVQMTGVSPAVAGSNMGNYDVATITSISGSDIGLSAITRTYSPGSEAVQLVRLVHDPATTTIVGDITAAPWDGTTGGVIALSGGALELDGDVDASGAGFTSDLLPTSAVTTSASTGPGTPAGRGQDGAISGPAANVAGAGGGGIGGGGGGVDGTAGAGGGVAGGGSAESAAEAPGTNGAAAGTRFFYGGTPSGAGGGGGVIGGGGGGGADVVGTISSGASGGGGGTDGGGAGGAALNETASWWIGAGGGGVRGVANGGDGLIGGASGSDPITSANEGSAGGGGGSYGGGGGAPSNSSGGDDSSGGGGGGSWTGGGVGGVGGVGAANVPYPAGGDGNAAVSAPLPDSAHYLNLANPRLMMGGAGGRGSQESGFSDGGAGGGIVFLDFASIAGAGAVHSDGGQGASPAGGGAHSGSGGGAGGQMRVRAQSVDAPLLLTANGGIGGAPTANLYHAGVSGGGGGAGGIWVELLDAPTTCPAAGTSNVTFELGGGNGGPSITNPKNNLPSGTGGAGGNGLGCVSPLQTPELTFDKSSDPTPGTAVKPGDEITYAVTIENTGTVVSEDGLVTDDMADVLDKATLVAPPAVTCAPVANSCGEVLFMSGDTEFSWQSTPAVPMDVGTTATVTYTVIIDDDATGTVGNLLVEPDVRVEHPIIEWSKTNDVGAGVLVGPGDTVVYTISVSNTGTVDAASFSAVDDLSDVVDDATLDVGSIVVSPAGLGVVVFDPAAETLTWTGALPAGETVEVSYAVVVDEDAAGELRNAFFDTTVVNPISAALQWNKVGDTADAELLAGAEWELTPLDGAGEPAGPALAVVDCVEIPCTGTDTDPVGGQFLVMGLTPGEYRLVETRAPVGFVLDTTPILVTVLDTASVTVLDDIVNSQQSTPVLPFTGGFGADHLLMIGGGLLVLMTGLGAWQAIRRRRTA